MLGFADDHTITEKSNVTNGIHIKVVLILPFNTPWKPWNADTSLYWLCHQTLFHHHKNIWKSAVWQCKIIFIIYVCTLVLYIPLYTWKIELICTKFTPHIILLILPSVAISCPISVNYNKFPIVSIISCISCIGNVCLGTKLGNFKVHIKSG